MCEWGSRSQENTYLVNVDKNNKADLYFRGERNN